MRLITLYGKGGIGKSTTAAALAILFQEAGLSVLHVGCDPKHDAALRHAPSRPVPTVMELMVREQTALKPEHLESAIVTTTGTGVHVMECGGPEPGKGCAGRAVSLALDLLQAFARIRDDFYDLAILDVLGDVVCGGFAAPLRVSTPADVILLVSRDFMSLYAANNIAKGISNLTTVGRSRLVGVIGNRIDGPVERELVSDFAARLGTRVLGVLPTSEAVDRATDLGLALHEPGEPSAYLSACLGVRQALEAVTEGDRIVPTPLTDEALGLLFAQNVARRAAPAPAPAR